MDATTLEGIFEFGVPMILAVNITRLILKYLWSLGS